MSPATMSTSSLMSSTSSGVSVRPSDLHVAVRRRRLHAVVELLASDAAWTLWAVGGTRMDPLQLAEAMEEHLNASGRHDEANRSREIAHHLRRHKETKDNAKLLTWLRRLRSKYTEMRAALRKSEEDDASSPMTASDKCSRLRQAISDTKSTLSVAREILAPKKKKASESSSAALDSCNCVVCWNIPSDVVLCCPTCETLLCKSCADRLSRSTCPCCRVGFEEVPPKRSRAVERILQSMRTTNQIPDDSDDDDEEEDYFGAAVDCSREHDQAHLIFGSSRSSPVSLTSSSSERVAITPRRRDNTRRLVFDILDDDLEDMVDAKLFCCCS